MEYSANVIDMLGQSRVAGIQEGLAAIRACVTSEPSVTSWVKHLPIPLQSSDRIGAQDELVERLRKSSPDWFYVMGTRPDGRRFGLASNLFRPENPVFPSDIGFLLFDMHSGLRGWSLSHLWRAADFAEAADFCFANWLVLPVAACVRALLEGVSAFVIEGEELLAEWSGFKQSGAPDLPALETFGQRFNSKLLQAQFGSRLGERSGTRPPPLKRTNVLTFLEKFAKRFGDDVVTHYEWLCDAVHPSFGFGTTYIATQGIHNTGAIWAADLARRTDTALTHISKIEPTVSWAAADVFLLAIRALLIEFPRIRWLIDDIGLTTGVASISLDPALRKKYRAKENAMCPCGSGLRFAACVHVWGAPAVPPTTNS